MRSGGRRVRWERRSGTGEKDDSGKVEVLVSSAGNGDGGGSSTTTSVTVGGDGCETDCIGDCSLCGNEGGEDATTSFAGELVFHGGDKMSPPSLSSKGEYGFGDWKLLVGGE